MDIYQAVTLFYQKYRGEKRIIGTSEEGRRLYAFFAGKHETPTALCQYAIHAREWVTALIAIEHIKRGVTRGGVWFVPLVNPDGALLVHRGVQDEGERDLLLRVNGGGDFSLWKANARGVDLNVNFPARWGKGAGNVTSPSPQGYIGSAPLSALETRALASFTKEVSPDYTVSYHTKGEEIYWRFFQDEARLKRDLRLAYILSRETGYPLKETPASAGGYKDWCIESLKLPAFTVEAGADGWAHPLGFEALPELIEKNIDAIERLNGGF